MGHHGEVGAWLFDGFVLGWDYLTPCPVPEGPQAEQTGLILPEWPLLPAKEHHPPMHLQLGDIPLRTSAGTTRRIGL